MRDEVLVLLEDGPLLGRNLHYLINKDRRWFWQRYGKAGFYTRMARMEDDGLVSHRDVPVRFEILGLGTVTVNLRQFQLTGKGREVLDAKRA